MKKKICSFVLIIAMLAMLLPSGLVGRTVYAESLGLDSYAGYYCRARVTNYNQLLKVNELSKSQTNNEYGDKIDKMLFHSTYRPTVVGGIYWVKNNDTSTPGVSSVYDSGLGTTVYWGIDSWGCYAYACFVSKYVRGSTGSAVSKGWGSVPSVSEVKSLIESYADPGEQIRFLYKQPSGSGSVHSVIYLASDDDGFYFLSEAGNDLTVSVLYSTYSYLQSILRGQSSESTIKVYDTNGGKDVQNSYFDTPPSDPKLTIYTNSVAAGKPILFEYSVKNAENIYIPIDVNGVREHFIEVSGDHYNGTFTKPGNYSAALYATNSVGNSGFSNWVNFVVYNTVPKNPKIAIYKKFVPAGEPILFEYSVDYAQNMYIPIDVNGTREHFIEVSGDHYNGTFTKPGYYSAALYATNEFGESEFSNWVDFVVYNTAPNPPSNIHSIKNSYTTKERISISWDEENTATNYWIYLWKDGEEILSQSNGINTTKDFGLLSVGNYTVLVRSENKFGVSNTSSFLFSVTESEYVISYDANGGMGAPAPQTKTHGEDLTLTTNKPSRNGYEFIGWSTDKNATSPTYTAGATFTTDADTTLNAVWKQISSIEIVTMPNKLDYNMYDYIDISGMKLRVSYSDGTTKDITMGVTISGEDNTAVDKESGTVFSPRQMRKIVTQEVLVEYAGMTTAFNVSVDDPMLTGIEIEKLPEKLVYNVGDTLDTTGISVLAEYTDGSSITRKIDEGYTCTPTVLNTAGTQEITVDYYGRTATFNVTVNRVLTSVTVKTNPDKLIYTMGDTLDPAGLVLTASYNDGYTEDIASGFTCTPADLTTVGTQEITVEYGGKTATFEVTVKEAYSLKASPASEQTIGEPVVLTATGGSSYRFYYEQNGKWVNIRNFSTENACLWIPTVPREYTIYVDIKDETGKVVTSKRIQYTVTDAYPFTLDKEGEQNVGVNLTLTAKGGSSYKFYYEYNGAWCNITFNTTGVCEWSPKFAGNYMLYVDIKDASGKVIACRTQAFKLNDPFLLANDAQSTEFSYGRTVNFTAAGGNQYKFYYEKQGEWQRVQDFSSKNTCAWTPTEAGTYNFYCDIKDASGAVVSCKRMTFNITNPYSFTADKATTQSVGTKITFTATGGYQYKFYYEKDGSWVRIQSFSTADTCTWTPTVAGRYNVYCDIADENGTVLAYKGIEFVIGNAGTTDYTFITSVESPQPMNTSVILSATGGASYKFYYEVGGKWATIQNFSTANTATWTPDMIADYTLYVDIKNSGGKVVKTLSKKFTATDPYSFTVNSTSPMNIGKSVTFTANGGASYKFYYQYSGAWVKIQDSASATCNWRPNKAGEYMVYVDIRNAGGTVLTCRTMKLIFNDPYTLTTTAGSLTQPAGTAISLEANGGTSYKFYYEKDGAWIRIRNFSATNTCTWKPTEAGTYNVYCDMKDASGSVAVCKRITFTITD